MDNGGGKQKAAEWELEYWRKVARDSAELEESEPPSPERMTQILRWANERRVKIGLPPLVDEDEDPPELEFYRIAKARGLLRRTDPGY